MVILLEAVRHPTPQRQLKLQTLLPPHPLAAKGQDSRNGAAYRPVVRSALLVTEPAQVKTRKAVKLCGSARVDLMAVSSHLGVSRWV